jgi:hypothetical protein
MLANVGVDDSNIDLAERNISLSKKQYKELNDS